MSALPGRLSALTGARRAGGALCTLMVLVGLAASQPLPSPAAPPSTAAAPAGVSYERDVLPLLRARCQGCHQPARREGDLDLTGPHGWLVAGDSGEPAVVPGDADASALIMAVTPDADGAASMPQQGPPLSEAEIALLRQWIAAGAVAPTESNRPQFNAASPPRYDAPAAITALDVSPDGRLIALSGTSEVLLLDAPAASRGEPSIAHRLIGRASRIESVRFSPGGELLAVVGGIPGEFGELQVWDVATGQLVLSQTVGADTLRGVAWSPDAARVACGASEAKLRVFDVATGQMAMEQGAHADWVTAVAFSSDGKFLISAARDQTLKLIDGAAGRLVDNITAVSPGVPGGPLFALARHPQRDMVAAGGAEGVPRTYLVHRLVERKIGDDSNLVRAYPKTIGRIFAAAFSPDGTRLATAASDGAHGRVEIYAVPEAIEPPQEIRLIQGKVSTERSAAEAAQLEAYHRAGAVRLASTTGAMGPAYAVAFLADGQQIVSGGADGLLRIHDAVHGSRVAQFNPFPASPHATEVLRADEPAAPVEFLTDVMPVLAKVGCNAGTCHGAREGQNGFSLSLRGYDPRADYLALTDDLAGRRVDRGRPEASLMLQKASGAAPHGGGVVLEPGSPRYETVRRWIAAGAHFNPSAPRVASIAVTPVNPVVDDAGATVAVRVQATYPDGSVRDVTGDAFIESGDTEVATADAAGVLTALRRGEAPILVRYEGAYAATTMTVMGDRRGFQPAAPPVYNRIDELVDAKLARLKIAASGLSTDEQFLRRVHLDLTGLPPTADAVRAFLADGRDGREKRARVVDDLLGSPDYVEHWTNRWADMLLVNGKFVGREGAAAYRQWIRTAVAENWPYDRLVREVITATGSTREHPAGSYYKALRSPELIAETTSHVFLGVRFNCNKCHDHPFERWTQDDYYSWAANFADVRLEKDPASGDRTLGGSAVEGEQPLYEFVADRPGGAVTHLRTGAAATAAYPYPAGGASAASGVTSRGGETLRGKTALWLTSPDNRYFASSFVNRVWAALTGVGLIEPVDDIRAGNPPTNPELLAWLTEQFVAHDFDVQWLIRTICASRTYQLSPETNRWNEDDRRNYSHALPRRLSAETLFDAVHRAVGSRSRLPGMPRGARAAELPDPGQELEGGLLSKLGRPARETGCECERSSELQLGPLMALVNGPTFAAAIDDPGSDLARLEHSTPDDGALVDEVFLRILNRAPTPDERTAALQGFEAPADDRPAVAEALAVATAALAPGYDAWRAANRPVAWTVLSDLEAAGPEGTQFRRLEDGSMLASGETAKGAYRLTAEAPAMTLRGLRLEALADDSLPRRGPGRAPNGNFVLTHVRLEVEKPDGSTRRAKFRTAEADYSQNDFAVAGAIDGKSKTGWGVDQKTGERHVAAFQLARPLALEPGSRVIVELDHQHDDKHLLGRFRLSLTGDAAPLLPPDHPAKWRDRLAVAPGELPPADEAELREYYFSLDRRYRDLERAQRLVANPRLAAVQDLAWALINSPAFLFNY